jgi:plastocyanin
MSFAEGYAMKLKQLARVAGLGVLCAAAGPMTRTNIVVHQKGRAFSTANLTVARGQTVMFENDDNVPHNVMSESTDNAFDLGSQAPGTVTPVTFDKVGVVQVICAIHPRMRMTIVVTH